MPDNNIKIAADITVNSKNVEQELNRVGKIAQQALAFDPQNKELQQLVNKANSLYDTVNKTTDALKLQKELESAITLQKQAQRELDDSNAQKRNIERDIVKAKNLGKSDIVEKKQADLEMVNRAIVSSEALVNEFTGVVATLKGKIAELSATGADIDRSLTFDNARVAATELLSLITKIESISTGVIEKNQQAVNIEPTIEYAGNTVTETYSDIEVLNDEVASVRNEVTQLVADMQQLQSSGLSGEELSSALNVMSERAELANEHIESLYASVDMLSNTDPKMDSDEEIERFDMALRDARGSANELSSTLNTLVVSQLPPVEIDTQGATENVNATTESLTELETKEEAVNEQPIDIHISTGAVDESSYKLQELLDIYNETQHRMADFNAMRITLSDEEYIQLNNALNEARANLDAYIAKITEARANTIPLSEVTSSLGAVISRSFRQASSYATSFLSAIGNRMTSALNKLKSTIEKTFSQRSFKRGLTTLLKYGFGVRSLYFAFRRLRKMVKEGLENLVKYEKAVGTSKELTSTNHAINELRTSLLYLKNAWGAAFAPIINAVMPYLRMLIDGIASAGNAVARFVAVLTGQQNVIQAVKVSAGDYADSLDDAAKSAGGAASAQKKLNDRLASFDDLNVLGKDNDTDGGGGGGSALEAYEPNPEDMFTIIDSYSEFADKLKSAFEQSGFFGIGKVISDSVSNWLENIDWEAVKQKANEVGTAIGDLFRGLFGNPDFWSNLGDAGAGIANALIYGLKGFLDSNKDVHYGQMIADGFNNFLSTVDWKQAGANIHDLATGILDNLIEFFKTLNTDEIDGAIHDFLGEVKIGDIVWKLGELLVEAAKVIIHVATELIVEGAEELGESWWEKSDLSKVTSDYATSENIQEKIQYGRLMQTAAFADWWDSVLKSFSNDAEIEHLARTLNMAFSEQQKYIERTKGTWQELQRAQSDYINSGFSEMGYFDDLYSELKSITDANGKIKDGYEDRAEFIAGEFSEKLGIEIDINDGIVKSIDGVGKAIDRLIKKKKAEIILNAQADTYAHALMNIDDATEKLTIAEKNYNALLEERTKLQNKHTEALEYTKYIEDNMNAPGFEITKEMRDAYYEYQAFLEGYDDRINYLSQDIATAKGIYDEHQSIVAEYTNTITAYQANMVLAEKGIYDSMVINIKDGTDRAKSAWDEGLDEELSAISGKDVKIIELANGMVQLFFNKTAYGIPMSKEAMTTFATETVNALIEGTEEADPGQAGTYVTEAVTDALEDPTERATLNAAAAGLGAGIVDAIDTSLETKQGSSKKAKTRGEYFVEGVGDGIGNQDKQNSVFSKIKSFGEKLLSKLSNALDERSPSKATAQMGVYLLEGLINGIEDETPNTLNTIAEFGNSVVDAFGGVADDVQSPMENMVEFVGGFIDILVEGISTLISKINELATIQPALSEFSRPSLPTIPMPSIAEGTVIPANSEFIKSIESQTLTGDEQYAMVKQAIAEVMANNGNGEVVRLLQQLIGVVESKNLVIGDKEIGKANARYVKQQNQIRGASF